MDSIGILSGIDNLFRFLFLGGIVLLIVGIVFPLQKEHEIQLIIVDQKMARKQQGEQIQIVKSEVSELKGQVESHMSIVSGIDILLDSLNSPSDSILREKARIDSISEVMIEKIDHVEDLEYEIKLGDIELDFIDQRIVILEKQLAEYNKYLCWFIWGGIISLIIGFWGWLQSYQRNKKHHLIQIAKDKLDLKNMQT